MLLAELYTLSAFPDLAFTVSDKAEIAHLAALAKRLGAPEVYVVQAAVIDDVTVAKHRAESLQQATLPQFILVQALQRLKMVIVLGVIRVPGIFPAFAGAVLEAQRDNLSHDTHKVGEPGKLLEQFWL